MQNLFLWAMHLITYQYVLNIKFSSIVSFFIRNNHLLVTSGIVYFPMWNTSYKTFTLYIIADGWKDE